MPASVAAMGGTEATKASRRSANWQARRQIIIDTSAPLFARSGYHATGITSSMTRSWIAASSSSLEPM